MISSDTQTLVLADAPEAFSEAPAVIRRNVLGAELAPCCAPTESTDGCCSDHDLGPTVCVVLTSLFIAHAECAGMAGVFNTRGGGRRAGEHCCVPAALWRSAYLAGIRPMVILQATDASVIDIVPLADLQAFALPVEADADDAGRDSAGTRLRYRGSRQIVLAGAALFSLLTFAVVTESKSFWLQNAMGYLAAGESAAIAVRPVINLPFAPPIGTPLTFAFERRIDDGDRSETIKATMQLVFFAAPDGNLLLKWVSLPDTAPGSGEMVATPAAGRPRARLSHIAGGPPERPLLYRLSRAGVPIALLDEAEALALLAGPTPDSTALPHLRRLLGMTARPQSLPRDARLDDPNWQATMLEAPRALLHGYDQLSPAGPTPGAITMESPFGGGSALYARQSRIATFTRGMAATVTISAATDTPTARRVARANIDARLATITDPVRRSMLTAAASNVASPVVDDEIVMTIALPSGLPSRVTQRKRLAIPGQPAALDIISYQRLS